MAGDATTASRQSGNGYHSLLCSLRGGPFPTFTDHQRPPNGGQKWSANSAPRARAIDYLWPMFAIPILAAGVGLAAIIGLLAVGGDDSAQEDIPAAAAVQDGGYGEMNVLLDALGWPYYWGGYPGVNEWHEGKAGVDCSLFVSLALVRLGKARKFIRYTTATLVRDCVPVPSDQVQPGDIAYYNGHVMMAMTLPSARKLVHVMGASGGGRSDKGQNPKAKVKIFETHLYRKDFIGFFRYRPGGSSGGGVAAAINAARAAK